MSAYCSVPLRTVSYRYPASPRIVLAGTDRVCRRLSESWIHPSSMAALCLAPFLAGRDAELSSGKHLTSASYGVTWIHHLLSLVAVAHRDSCYCPVLFNTCLFDCSTGRLLSNKWAATSHCCRSQGFPLQQGSVQSGGTSQLSRANPP